MVIMLKQEILQNEKIICYHCGDDCPSNTIRIEDKYFCCEGCKLVYEILEENQLCKYYSIEDKPGKKQNVFFHKEKYSYLDDEDLIKQLLDFSEGDLARVSFVIPSMHCSSCIWLLENLHKINPAFVSSRVDFLNKTLTLTFNKKSITLRQVVELLASIGYEPEIKYDLIEKKKKVDVNKKLYYKIGIAGFAFGNIMLLSFPEYLAIDESSLGLKGIFGWLSIIISLPLFFYSGSDYLISAYKGLRRKIINIDVPLALGIIFLFFRSVYEIAFQVGAGYLDSLAGLLFFMNLGRLFQNKTFETLNFERDYKSFFPLAVSVKVKGIESTMPISRLKSGDKIVIRNNELIPADAVLYLGEANIDYSFVTGESLPVKKNPGEIIYAGGRQTGSAIELEVIKEVSQSYLTRLWNENKIKREEEHGVSMLANKISRYFTPAILFIALAAALYWIQYDIRTAVNVFTAVLIIACPCALALSTPFTMGNAIRILGKNKFYLKNTAVIERLNKIDTVVFDKTGTITQSGEFEISFVGNEFTDYEREIIKSLVKNSTHPLSLKIAEYLGECSSTYKISDYEEIPGEGIEALIDNKSVKAGSRSFIASKGFVNETRGDFNTKVYISIDRDNKGFFLIKNSYRAGLESLITELKKDKEIHLITGDNEGEKTNLLNYFPDESKMNFHQTPVDKLEYINRLNESSKKVLMLGDGLNDAGALANSYVGVTISESSSYFSPACDGILDASRFPQLVKYLNFAKTSNNIVVMSFIISLMYNVIGISVAVQGLLSPIFAAILMPVSSISVVLFATLSTSFLGKRRGLL